MYRGSPGLVQPVHRERSSGSARVFQADLPGFDDLVATGLPHEALVDAVQVDLLVEGHRGQVVEPETVDAVVLIEALFSFMIVYASSIMRVEFRAGVVRQDIAGAEERYIDVLGVEAEQSRFRGHQSARPQAAYTFYCQRRDVEAARWKGRRQQYCKGTVLDRHGR